MSETKKLDIKKLKEESRKRKANKAKDYSINKIAAGLREMVKQSYVDGVTGFARDIDSIFDENVMDTLIRDFPNFESVLLLTGDVRFC